MKPTRLIFVVAIFGLALSGCVNLAPKYKQPTAPVSDAWPNTPLVQSTTTPIEQSALAVESARTQFRIARADTLPAVDAVSNSTIVRSDSETSRSYSVSLGISAFELDFFGRLNNLRDQALETYLSNEETLRSMRITLVAEVATAYYTLAADQRNLRLAERTLQSQQKSLNLTQKTFQAGAASGLDVATAQTSVDTARADIAIARTQVAQDINSLTLLVGQPIDAALLTDTGASVSDPLAPLIHTIGPVTQAPSELLQRRPDVLAAERALRAANANIGAARAARFPRITLTTSAGSASNQLSDLFGSGTSLWTFAPSVSTPIFDAGARKANVRVAQVT